MPVISVKLASWSGEVDTDQHVTFKATFQCRTSDPEEGPYTVLSSQLLPLIGDGWSFFKDQYVWAWCRPERKATPRVDKERNLYWDVECTFSTKPLPYCQDGFIEDPLQIKDRISGGFRHDKEEITTDYLGRDVRSSSFELFKGPKAEFDDSKPTIKVVQNRPILQLALLEDMIDKVNALSMWGFPPATIKLSRVTWDEKFTAQCVHYYERTLEFEINVGEQIPGGVLNGVPFTVPIGWSRKLRDEGTKYVRGHWDPVEGWYVIEDNPSNSGIFPDLDNLKSSDFVRAKDIKGDLIFTPLINGLPPEAVCVLDGFPDSAFLTGPPGHVIVTRYGYRDFSLLGLPAIPDLN